MLKSCLSGFYRMDNHDSFVPISRYSVIFFEMLLQLNLFWFLVVLCCLNSRVRKYDLADVTITVNNLESASCDRTPESEPCKNESQSSNFRVKDSTEPLHFTGTSSPSSVQVQRKAGKMSRSSSRCSKRPRFAQLEDSTSSAGVDVIKDISDNLGPYHTTKCNSLGNTLFLITEGSITF